MRRLRDLPHHWKVFSVTGAAVFVVSLDGLLVPIALPKIEETFPDVPETTLSWVVTAYTIALAALVVSSGRIGDRTGRRRTFTLGVVLFSAGSALAGLAPTAGVLIAARAVQGTGHAFLVPSSLGLLLASWPADDRTRAIAAWVVLGGTASALGPTVGSLVVAGPGWRAVFGANVIVGLVTLSRIGILDDTERDEQADLPDPAGIALLGIGLGAFTLALVKGRQWGWSDPVIMSAVAVVVAVTPVFIRRSRSHPAPVIDLDLLGVRTFRLAIGVSIFLAMSMFTNLITVTQFMDEVWGYSALRTGLALTPLPLVAVATAPTVRRLASRYGHRNVLVGGLAVNAAGFAWLALRLGEDHAYLTTVAPSLILVGIGGWGAGLTMLNSVAVEDMREENYGVGTAILVTVRHVGGLVGVAAFFGLFADGVGGSLIDGYRLAWAILVAVGLAALAFAARLPARVTVR